MKDDSRPLIEQSGLSDARKNRERKRRRDRKQASFQGDGIERGVDSSNSLGRECECREKQQPTGGLVREVGREKRTSG